jgi:tetratricopeptide (TPR) repeat protein
MAFHAEEADDVAAVLRYAPAAARRAAALASHREAAAQFERALRFAADTDEATTAALYVDLAEELLLLDRTEEAAEAIGRGLELWRAVGDRRSQGDATRRLSSVLWHLARGQEATAAAETAVAILEPLPAGIELARAYANLAARRMMAARHEEATEAAQRAQSIAATHGARAVVSDALNTESVSAFHLTPWNPGSSASRRSGRDSGERGIAVTIRPSGRERLPDRSVTARSVQIHCQGIRAAVRRQALQGQPGTQRTGTQGWPDIAYRHGAASPHVSHG